MPSAGAAGRVFDIFRIGKKLTTLAGAVVTISTGSRLDVAGTLRFVPRAAPTGTDLQKGVLYYDVADEKLKMYTGSGFIVIGTQA